MANAVEKDIGKIIAEGTQIDEAVKQAVKEAVLKHKQAGNPIVGMKDGQMVWIKPQEISV
jgi:isoaspartyl peptidase/L-asparaginase-like protein (Ntn-hydrolase superfamily)